MNLGAGDGQLQRLIESCILYLRVERNLSPRTLAAYRGDYLAFAASLRTPDEWKDGAGPAQRWIAGAGSAPSTRRRRAAAKATTRPRPAIWPPQLGTDALSCSENRSPARFDLIRRVPELLAGCTT